MEIANIQNTEVQELVDILKGIDKRGINITDEQYQSIAQILIDMKNEFPETKKQYNIVVQSLDVLKFVLLENENEKTAKFKISSLTTNGLNVELGITFWTNCLYREAMFGLKQYFEIVGFMLRCKGFYMDNITFFQAYIQGKKLEQTDEEKDKENNKENNEENNKLLEAIPKIKDVLKDVYAPLLRNHHTTDRDLPYKHMNTFIAQLIFYILESSLIRTDYHEPLKEGWHIPEVKVTKNVCLFIYDILAANNCLYPEENNEDFKYRTIKPLLKNRRRLSN